MVSTAQAVAAILRPDRSMPDTSATISARSKTLFNVVWRTVENFFDQQGMQWAGAVAFYLALSVPPLLIAGSSIAVSVFDSEEAKEILTRTVTRFIPIEQGLVDSIADETIDGFGPAAIVSIGFLLFSGTRVFAALVNAIHVMWEEVDQAGFVRTQVIRAVFLASVGVLFVLAGILDGALEAAADVLPLEGLWTWLFESQVIPVTLLFAALFLLLKLLPHKEPTWTSAAIGAALGAIGLRIAQWGFTLFDEMLADFEEAYGPLAGVGALMTWALVASVVILLAAHLVAVLNRPDTPTGGSRNTPEDDEDDGGEREKAVSDA
jgi:membrane protein